MSGYERQPGAATVAAAQQGDRKALDELIRGYLPLLYNVVGRALDGHADVDDLVQETMLRAVDRIGELRDPERFRSWLMAIAMRQMRDRWRAPQPLPTLPQELDTADPEADFTGLTILRLGLSGQRREAAEATRWLETDERGLLSLWWLETAGELTRAELAEASGLTPAHTAVRVQRLKERLDTARGVVRALRAEPRCPDLSAIARGWNGVPSALWRKRLARHIRECPRCSGYAAGLAPAEGLLAGLALVPLPAGYLVASKLLSASTSTAAAGLMGWAVAKPVALSIAGTVVVAGGVGAYVYNSEPGPRQPDSAVAGPLSPGPAESAPHPPPRTSSPTAGPTRAPSRPAPAVYGQTVDKADHAPDPNARPAALPKRPERRPLSPGEEHVMIHRDDQVTLTGQGYVQVRYQIVFTERPGSMVMPTWTGLKGKLFHVASGGGYRMDDPKPGHDRDSTWMGNPEDGYTQLPPGAQQMWQNEYFYLDGAVTLTNHERGADYNLIVTPVTRAEVVEDVTTPPAPDAPDSARIRHGFVRDTGDDAAPVPQYLTRARPADPARDVPQRSKVGPP